jgi:hypothetical protein
VWKILIDEYVAIHSVAFYTTYHFFGVHFSFCRRATCYGTTIIHVVVIINKCIGNDMLHTEYANTDQILMLAEIFFKYWSISDWVISVNLIWDSFVKLALKDFLRLALMLLMHLYDVYLGLGLLAANLMSQFVHIWVRYGDPCGECASSTFDRVVGLMQSSDGTIVNIPTFVLGKWLFPSNSYNVL